MGRLLPTDHRPGGFVLRWKATVVAMLVLGAGLACSDSKSSVLSKSPSNSTGPTVVSSDTAGPSVAPSDSAEPSDSAQPTESVDPSSTAEVDTESSVTLGSVFYSDSFRDRTKGWPEAVTESGEYKMHPEYAGYPVYTVKATKPGVQLFLHPEFRGITQQQLQDYAVTATIQTTLQVSTKDYFGVVCRELDRKRYSFEMAYDHLSDDDTMPWVIVKHDKAELDVLARGRAKIGGSAFEISGACVTNSDGSAHLEMYVNDEFVGGVDDDDAPLAAGYGGVYLYTKDGNSTVNVLNFAAKQAELD
jgi:hypothetical protein